MDFPFGETVIHHKHTVTGKNSHNQPIYGFVDQTLNNVAIFNGSTSEVSSGVGVKVSTGKSLVIMEQVSIGSQDKVSVRGVKYDVDGDSSGPRFNPFTGDFFGTKIQLRRTTGG